MIPCRVHLAATYDETGGVDSDNPRSQLILYINGNPYYNENFNRFLPNRLFGGVVCEIGCRIRGDGVTALDFFDGLIDEVRVLEKALSADEIRQVSLISSPPHPHLVLVPSSPHPHLTFT